MLARNQSACLIYFYFFDLFHTNRHAPCYYLVITCFSQCLMLFDATVLLNPSPDMFVVLKEKKNKTSRLSQAINRDGAMERRRAKAPPP